MGDHAALFAAVLADPEDDTLRLAWADALDERGTGDDADRAELVRVQCELAKRESPVSAYHPPPAAGAGMHNSATTYWFDHGADYPELKNRERQLRAAHPGWSACRCPACDGHGSGWRARPVRWDCETCGATGDLLARRPWAAEIGYTSEPRVLSWHAGYPASLACRLGEATGAWGRAVVAAVPVTMLAPADREPAGPGDIEVVSGLFWWFRGLGGDAPVLRHHLPPTLFDLLDGGVRRELPSRVDTYSIRGYATRELAAAALGRACARFARGTIPRFPADPSGPASTPAGNL